MLRPFDAVLGDVIMRDYEEFLELFPELLR